MFVCAKRIQSYWYRYTIVLTFTNFKFNHRKDFELSQLSNRIEDEQAIAIQLQKKLKELQVMYNLHNLLSTIDSTIRVTKRVILFWLNRPVLKSWRKSLRQSELPEPRWRSRDQTWPESWRRSVRGWKRPVEQHLSRLKWTRRGRLSSWNCAETLKRPLCIMKPPLPHSGRNKLTVLLTWESR